MKYATPYHEYTGVIIDLERVYTVYMGIGIIQTLLEALLPTTAPERAVRLLTPQTLRARGHSAEPPHPCECAPLPYHDELVRTAMHLLKYKGRLELGVLFGATISPYVAELLAERRMFGRFHTALVTPVPLSAERLGARGYNQAELIARTLLKELGEHELVYGEPLRRVHETPSQTTLHGRRARFKNLEGAFRATMELRGMDVIILDDVVTTGATLTAAQTELYRAGAREVMCIAVAH